MSQGLISLPVTGTFSGLTEQGYINTALAALATLNSGSSAPDASGTGLVSIAGILWRDTSVTPNLLKIRDDADSTWITIGSIDQTGKLFAAYSGAAAAVAGPASATDNALVRFDATTGKLVQNSVGILDDNGSLTLTGTATIGSFVRTSASASGFSCMVLAAQQTSPADNDVGGILLWTMRDDGSNTTTVVRLIPQMTDVSDGTEDARLRIDTIIAGTLAARGYWGAGLFTASATGGDKGIDTINALDLYIAGTSIKGFLARAWCSISDAAGTPTVEDGLNVTSVTDDGVGLYQINLAITMPNATYAPTVTPSNVAAARAAVTNDRNTTNYDVEIRASTTATLTDCDFVTVVHGDSP